MTVETEVQVCKTQRGAEGAAAKWNAEDTLPGRRYAARPCAIRPSRFVVVRFDGDAVREGDSITRPDRVRPFGGERDVASMRGKRSRSRERDTFNRRVFA